MLLPSARLRQHQLDKLMRRRRVTSHGTAYAPQSRRRLSIFDRARLPPAEADMQAFFRVTPPSVHRMSVELEDRGLIRRQPGQARSIELLLPPEDLPILR
jgi:hypothetical protein